MDRITLPKPDDLHTHVRQGDMMRLVAPFTASVFARALIMPNDPPIESAEAARLYRGAILEATEGSGFTPLSSIKLTHRTTPKMIEAARADGVIAGKVYPSGATHASHDGIRDLDAIGDVLRAMEDVGMVLCIHAEEPGAFVLDREEAYLSNIRRVLDRYPGLRIVVEHISTARAVDFIGDGPSTLAATITPVHLLADLGWIVGDGLRPHNFMKPIPKRPEDREAIVWAAVSGQSCFFAGTDSAPHPRGAKESACGCAGVFSAPVALPVYTSVFERHGGPEWVGKLTSFLSHNGADFYGLPRNEGTITLARDPWRVPDSYFRHAGGETLQVVPFLAGETLDWRVEAG
jgi:dihydroorotase